METGKIDVDFLTMIVFLVLTLAFLTAISISEDRAIVKMNDPVSVCFAKAKNTAQFEVCKSLHDKKD
jgi:hypothetical protein